MQENKSNILLYQTEDGVTKIETRLLDETVWLTQAQMATLFDKGRVTITEHINNIFKEGELNENSVSRKFRHTRYALNLFDTKSADLQSVPTSERIKPFFNCSEIPNS
ncbi:hypothetical protein [Flavobacterium limnophilum]|uniref:hypothetical protein n=1 Tax=Flavobacterium limnophilum TaxID=3003262 RepID=UPI002482CD33|nr:hypothetical protein [Flavobacterium limnophilum]